MMTPKQIELTIRASDQYAHAYVDGRCVATLQRRRMMESKDLPAWRVHDTNGKLILEYADAPLFTSKFKRDIAAHFNDIEEAAKLESAEKRLFNCCANGSAPDWRDYDHLEISACRNESEDENETDTQQCGIGAAEFFTVYGRLKPMNDGVMLADAITDIVDAADVLPVAVELMRRSGLPCSLAKWMTQEN